MAEPGTTAPPPREVQEPAEKPQGKPAPEQPNPSGPAEQTLADRISRDGEPDQVLRDIAGGQQASEINVVTPETTALVENPGETLNKNIAALVDRINEGGADTEQAKQILGRLLKIREQTYVDAAQEINPTIQRVEGRDNVYRIADTEIYGSIAAVMDATPALATSKQLAERLKIRLPKTDEVLSGETIPPRALMETSVVFGGSSAQDRIQRYPGDRDMQEYVRIYAATPQEAASTLARGIQESVDQQIEIVGANGEQITLHFSEMKLGGKYPEDTVLPNGDPKIRWSAAEVKQGYKEYQTKTGETKRITLEQACLRSDVLKVDYIGVTEDSVMEVTKQTTIQDTPENGDDAMTNDTGSANAFQEVYFDDPASFGVIEMTYDPDKFVQYVNVMADQVKVYGGGDHMNGLKVAKRLYNLAKTQGDLALSQEVSQIFATDAARAGQLIDRLNISMLAQRKSIDVSVQQTAIAGQLRQLLAGSSNPMASEVLATLEQGEDLDQNFGALRAVSMSMINAEYQKFLSEHPKVAARISKILSG